VKQASGSTELICGSLTQFDLERSDNPCGGIDKQSRHFADRLPVSRNYRSSSKLFIRNLHRRTS
jgi:hypothetical protein